MTMVLGPSPRGPDDLDLQGTVIREATVNKMPYLGSFNHKPSDLEKDKLAPDSHRQYDDEGNDLPWEK